MTHRSAWIAAALVAAAGCAAVQAQRARDRSLRSQLDALRYREELDQVWPEVRRLLARKGFPLAGKDAQAVGQEEYTLFDLLSPGKETRRDVDGGLVLETGWGAGHLRYRARGTADGAGCRVTFTSIREDLTERGRDSWQQGRDPEMELELLRRLDPESAARIEAALGPAPGG